MNQTQKNYTLKRIDELAATKAQQISREHSAELNKAKERNKPEEWGHLTKEQKAKVIDKAIRAKKLKRPTTLQIVSAVDHGFYRPDGLKVAFPKLEIVMAEVNAESIRTSKEFEKERKGIDAKAQKRRDNVQKRVTALKDEIMLGEDAERALQALAAFEKESF